MKYKVVIRGKTVCTVGTRKTARKEIYAMKKKMGISSFGFSDYIISVPETEKETIKIWLKNDIHRM